MTKLIFRSDKFLSQEEEHKLKEVFIKVGRKKIGIEVMSELK